MAVNHEMRTAVFAFGLRQPSGSDALEGTIFLGNLAVLITKKFEELASNNDVLSAGTVIMERTI
jgi:hypothetical protein